MVPRFFSVLTAGIGFRRKTHELHRLLASWNYHLLRQTSQDESLETRSTSSLFNSIQASQQEWLEV